MQNSDSKDTITPYPEVASDVHFPDLERDVLAFWKEQRVFEASVDQRAQQHGDGSSNAYVFYDGPPFANGLPHHGHLLTGFVKDAVARYQTMRGRRVERRFGWDCHGLPAEMEAEKQLGVSGRQEIMAYGIGKFNDHCRSSVMRYRDEWEAYVNRQARWVDFENDYKTMDTPYMESVLWAFSELYKKGLIYEGFKVMPYSWAAETVLSSSEIRLDDATREKVDKAIEVAFKLKEKPQGAPEADEYYVCAWTTTPWTLPSNLALAVSGEINYAAFVKEVDHSPPAGESKRTQSDSVGGERIASGKSDFATEKAQEMRKDPTKAEKLLWQHLQKEQLGYKFRRQQPIGNYIVDFYNSDKRLVIELDGGQHADNEHDRKRTKWLESQGLKVLRFWNHDVLSNCEGVLSVIKEKLEYPPHQIAAGDLAPPQGGSTRRCYFFAASAIMNYVDAVAKSETKTEKKTPPGTTETTIKNVGADGFILGNNLIGLAYEPLFPYFADHPNAFRILDGSDFIEEGSGTGIVHMAPGFGEDDQRVCAANGIEVVVPVDEQGRYTDAIYDIGVKNGHVCKISNAPYGEFLPLRAGGGQEGGSGSTASALTTRNPDAIAHAKSMRKESTDAEAALWNLLRRKQLEGYKFRRQHPIGAYIADFACVSEKLLIELDGGQHAEPDHQQHDARRTEVLERDGYKVLRFWNHEMLSNPEGVLEVILDALHATSASPHLTSPRTQGEEYADSPALEEYTATLSLRGLNVIAETKGKRDDEPYSDAQLEKYGLANLRIISWLKATGHLVKQEDYAHNYPHCWRTDKPIIYKAMSSWFVDVPKIRDRMVELNQQINWIPEHIRDGRFGKWLENAREWSISRSRFWGCPIPVWRSDNPENTQLYVFGSIAELEAFFGVEVADLHKPFIDTLTKPDPTNPAYTIRRVDEVFDCWFESGSMPYAQVHYPFENKEWFEANFPADFIVEYEAQTRGWFYNMMVLSVGLFDRIPFKNCICHGVVLDNHVDPTTGKPAPRKLSKKLKNYVDPNVLFDTYGSDALRWFMLSSPIMRGQELFLDPEGAFIRDAVRLYIKPLWNAYHFFCLYANADGVTARYDTSSGNLMDRYILAKLSGVTEAVQRALDAYDTPGACVAITGFLEVLTNWYIRRNRARFWGEGQDADKLAAYNTLFTVLDVLCRIAAPLLPQVTEAIYRGLHHGRISSPLAGEPKSASRDSVGGQLVSAHLTDYPTGLKTQTEDASLMRAMDRVQDICNTAHAIRNEVSIRIRQPLAKLTVYGAGIHDDAAYYRALIADETNVKDVVFSDDLEAVATRKLKIHFPIVGKRLGAKMKEITAASRSGDWAFQPDGTVAIAGEVLTRDEFEFTLESTIPHGAGALSAQDGLVVLDTVLTDTLVQEGIARDLVRFIQQSRKDAGLHISDRIHLSLYVSRETSDAVKAFEAYICEQTLTASLTLKSGALPEGEGTYHTSIAGADVALTLQVASTAAVAARA